MLRILLVATLLGLQANWTPARPDFRWSFPRDHWAHPDYRTEWWYFTGQLAAAGDTAPRFGYQFTFFRIGVLREPPRLDSDWATQMLVMGHAAVTDLSTGRHLFSEVLVRAVPNLAGFGAEGDSMLVWSRAPAGTPGRWTLRWTGDGFRFSARDSAQRLAFDLEAAPTKPLVFQGPNGFSRKGPGPTSASLYYSFTRLATTGTLALDGAAYAVRGESWMDKEFFSNSLTDDQVGWDWFSLQLTDGRELMLYLLRDSSGATTWSSGTLVSPTGAPRWLDRTAFTVRPSGTWTSPATGAAYPARWTVSVPSAGLILDIEPLVSAQENRSRILPPLFYWEGAVRVRDNTGRPAGRGYVELVGYGSGRRPAL